MARAISREVVQGRDEAPDTGEDTHPFPVLGFREYWYPALPSKKVRRKPVHVQLLGEHVVLFRDPRTGKIGALPDRCAHRGLALSKGRIYFPGTITCAYHGWTFDMSGQCVAMLTEGPDCPLAKKVRLRAYPVEEVNGLVFIWMGDGPPVPLREDLPEEFLLPDSWILTDVQTWNANWRPVLENDDAHHAPILHRHSVQLVLFYDISPVVRTGVQIAPDGLGVGHYRTASTLQVDYPGLGTWPPRPRWYALLKKLLARDRQKVAGSSITYRPLESELPEEACRVFLDVRLPGWRRVVVRNMPGNILWLWGVPIDEHTTRDFFIDVFRVRGPFKWLKKLRIALWYYVYMYWVSNRHFNGQDRMASENQRPGPNRLSGNDRTILAFRKIAATRARDVIRSNGSGPGSQLEPVGAVEE